MKPSSKEQNGMLPILYHATPRENVASILEKGLLRNHGDHRNAFISLSERPDSWMHDGLTLLDVDIRGMKCRMTWWFEEGLDEVCVWGDIPADRIKLHEEGGAK